MRDFYDDCAKLPWGNPSDSTFTNSRKHCSGIGQKHGKQGRGGECSDRFQGLKFAYLDMPLQEAGQLGGSGKLTTVAA